MTRRRFIHPAPMRDFDVEDRRSTWLELFFDLCFVAAVAALSEGLTRDPTLHGVLRFAGLFVPVWWAWMEFTWFATAWDDDLVFRLGMLSAMLLVVVLAAAIPGVGKGESNTFVLAYVSMQLVLVLLFLRVLPHAGEARTFARNYLIGDLLGGAIWLSSLWIAPPGRYWIWALGVALLMIAPVFAVRAYSEQPFDDRHIPERYGLFTIIVLGESVVAIAAGLGEEDLNRSAILTGALGFGIAAAIWWSYFETVSSSALSRGRVAASFLWGYGHLFAYAGIATTAVGVELAIQSAAAEGGLAGVDRALLAIGPASFLLALVTIHEANDLRWDLVLTERMGAIGFLVGLALLGRGIGPLAAVGAVFAVLVVATVLDVRHTEDEGLQAEHGPSEEELSPTRMDGGVV